MLSVGRPPPIPSHSTRHAAFCRTQCPPPHPHLGRAPCGGKRLPLPGRSAVTDGASFPSRPGVPGRSPVPGRGPALGGRDAGVAARSALGVPSGALHE
eukprot:5293168-Prymnesium_polylepis.1